MKQKQTVSLLAKAIQNPTFLRQKLKQKDKKNEPDQDVASNKRRRSILDHHVSKNVGVEELVFQEGGSTSFSTVGDIRFQQIGHGSMENAYKDDVGIGQFGDENFYVKLEPREYGEIPRFGDWKLEKLSVLKPQLIMEGRSLEKWEHKPIDVGFLEEVINAGIEEIGTLGNEEGGDDLAVSNIWDSWVQT